MSIVSSDMPEITTRMLLRLVQCAEEGCSNPRLHPSVQAALIRRRLATPYYDDVKLTQLGWFVAHGIREAD